LTGSVNLDSLHGGFLHVSTMFVYRRTNRKCRTA
jgi:hypothetical protein